MVERYSVCAYQEKPLPHPYEGLPARAFWRSAVAEIPAREVRDLWRPKFSIGKDDAIATLGSCFAQHLSRALIEAGYHWLNVEPAPRRFPASLKAKFQYDIFSARLGNVYTVASLRQWTRWAFDLAKPPDEVWRKAGRFYDPFRPNIEPDGFASEEDCLATRQQSVRLLRKMFEGCRVFVFTLGLTEAWINFRNASVYPMCPGTFAGEFTPAEHAFKNYSYPEIYADLCEVVQIIRQYNPTVKILLTVSPVPLVATASGEHVLVATMHAKSVLRAVAGAVATAFSAADYFPSYELVSSFPFKAMFYERNLRSVSPDGVAFVMNMFLRELAKISDTPTFRGPDASVDERGSEPNARRAPGSEVEPEPVDEVCEEMILEASRPTS